MDVLLDKGEIALVTLNRPERLNAISWGLVDRFYEVLDEVSRDESVRVVVLTGAGRGFCSGTDLRDSSPMAGADASRRYELQRKVAGLVVRMREIPQPLVAAVNGPAAGGGLSLACACDVRVCSPEATFIASYIRIGLSGGDLGGSWFLPRIVGAGNASRVLLCGSPIGAEEALRMGLVSEVAVDCVGAARKLAEEIAANTAFGVRLTKELLNASLSGAGLQQMVELENRSQILCTLSDGFPEAVASFRDRSRKG